MKKKILLTSQSVAFKIKMNFAEYAKYNNILLELLVEGNFPFITVKKMTSVSQTLPEPPLYSETFTENRIAVSETIRSIIRQYVVSSDEPLIAANKIISMLIDPPQHLRETCIPFTEFINTLLTDDALKEFKRYVAAKFN
jgi:hypothetical protein